VGYLRMSHGANTSKQNRNLLAAVGGCFSGELFSASSKVLLPEKQPGGWSARGQPCDAVHSVFRKYMTYYSESLLGYRGKILDSAYDAPLLLSNGNR